MTAINETVYAYAGGEDLLVQKEDIDRLKLEMGDNLNLTWFPDFGHSIFKEGFDMSYLDGVLSVLLESNNTRLLSSSDLQSNNSYGRRFLRGILGGKY